MESGRGDNASHLAGKLGFWGMKHRIISLWQRDHWQVGRAPLDGHTHTSSIKWTQCVIQEKNVDKCKEEYMRELEGGKGREKFCNHIKILKVLKQAVGAHVFNSSNWKAGTGRSMSSRPTLSTERVRGKSMLH